VRAALATIALVAVVVATVGAAAQSEFAVAFFEWESPRSFTGVVTLAPAPRPCASANPASGAA